MAHHKRKRPKHQRAGCLACKPWKDERGGGKYAAPAQRGDARRLEATSWTTVTVAGDASFIGCPHGRSDWRHCVHCLGLNQTV